VRGQLGRFGTGWSLGRLGVLVILLVLVIPLVLVLVLVFGQPRSHALQLGVLLGQHHRVLARRQPPPQQPTDEQSEQDRRDDDEQRLAEEPRHEDLRVCAPAARGRAGATVVRGYGSRRSAVQPRESVAVRRTSAISGMLSSF